MQKIIKIRNAVESDYFAINELYFETYSSYHKNIPESYHKTPKTVLPKGTFLNMIDDNDSLIIVAEIEKKVIGMLYANIEIYNGDEVTTSYRRVSISEIAVTANHIGRGVGAKLMNHAEEWAKRKNIKELTVLVYSFNKKAIGFYEKNGFESYSIMMDKKI